MSLLLTLLACGEKEGDQPGECTDGADNDSDGTFDCADNDCWGAPDCLDAEVDTDTDADGDTDTDADADADADTDVAPFAGVYGGGEVSWELVFDFVYEPTGVHDCVEQHNGTLDGEVAAEGLTVTFEGTWVFTSTDCAQDTPLWHPDEGQVAYHTLVFTDDTGSTLDAWYVHEKLPSGKDTNGNGYDDAIEAQATGFYALDASADGGDVSHTEEQEVPDVFLTITHNLDLGLDLGLE